MNIRLVFHLNSLVKQLRVMDENMDTSLEEFDAVWAEAQTLLMQGKEQTRENRRQAFFAIHRAVIRPTP